MAIWFRNRPVGLADPTEALVAEKLQCLDDSWRIRWGYFYEGRGHHDREGDFIILGPDGRILVLEVKSGQNRHFVLTGEWEHGVDNPMTQLLDEWQAAISSLQEAVNGTIPFVGKALGVPHVNLVEGDRLQGEFSRDMLVLGRDLDDFPGWWKAYMAKNPTHCPQPEQAFHKAFAKGLQPASVQLFIRQTDLLFDRFKAAEQEILEMMQDNRQLLVEGGVGSGKTFLALQQAKLFAEQGSGLKVLLLSYNLLLTERLERMVTLLRPARGEIVVRSWQALLDEIIATEGLTMEIPREPEKMALYFQYELPGLVRLVLAGDKVQPLYDALVVDEAQDHDTLVKGEKIGWWSWYFALLREGPRAPMALFYDQAQRHTFRGAEGFDPELLSRSVSQCARLRLRRTLRYTMPLLQYLSSLESEGTVRLRRGLRPHGKLPTGPGVECRQANRPEQVKEAVESILREWKKQGLCQPDKCVLIGLRKDLVSSSLGEISQISGFAVEDYREGICGKLAYLGAHRSKGMDFLAVIVIDYPAFAEITSPDKQEGFFLAASRARQLLGIVECQNADRKT